MNASLLSANLGEKLALEVCPPTCDMGIPIWNDRIVSKQRLARASSDGGDQQGLSVMEILFACARFE